MSSSDTKMMKLAIQPGVNKNTTDLDAEGCYIDSDKVRFFYGKPEKIGGWQRENYQGTIDGVTREMTTWVDLQERKYLGLATHKKLYLLADGTLTDITPIDHTNNVTAAFSTTNGSTTVRVNVVPTNVQVGDSFIISAAGTVGGILLNGQYLISNVQPSYIEFVANTPATSTVSNSGNGTLSFYLTNGLADNGGVYGWGAGTWNSGTWGTPRAMGIATKLRLWSLDNYGEDLLANPRGGGIYQWDATNGVNTRAKLVTAAPANVNLMMVSREGRHVVAFGCQDEVGNFDPLLVRWSDTENINNWTSSDTSLAGENRLESGSVILGSLQTRLEIVVWTDETLWSMRHVGGDYVFDFKDLGKHNGLISQNACVDVNGIPHWMGFNTFQCYDGAIQTLPCTVQEFLFNPTSPGAVNMEQKEKVYASTNRQFNEVWWFYPSRDSLECDRYVVYNFLEKTWYVGTMRRTCYHDVDIFERPYGVTPGGKLFIHEQGKDADTLPMPTRLVTSMFDADDGQSLMFLDRIVPDNRQTKEITYTINYKKYPQSDEVFTKGPYTVLETTKKISTRVRGRQMQLVYESNILGGDFRLGGDRLSMKPDGMR